VNSLSASREAFATCRRRKRCQLSTRGAEDRDRRIARGPDFWIRLAEEEDAGEIAGCR